MASGVLGLLSYVWNQSTASPEPMIAANAQLRLHHKSMTAAFTGATHGIGLGTLKAFLKHIPEPKVFIVGRSRENFAKELEDLQSLNPNAEITFLEAQLSLISDVDELCQALKQRLPSHGLDLLCMSQGYAPVGERKYTSEGLDEAMALGCYGRVRLAERLISAALMAQDARVISVLGGGKEGHLFEDDMELEKGWSIPNIRGHFTSMMTLAFDKLSEENPELGFLHVYPGTVSTGLLTRGIQVSFALRVLLNVVEILTNFVAMTLEVAGERVLWIATVDKFATGSFSLGFDGSVSQSTALEGYRKDNRAADVVWKHLLELFARAQSSDSYTANASVTRSQ